MSGSSTLILHFSLRGLEASGSSHSAFPANFLYVIGKSAICQVTGAWRIAGREIASLYLGFGHKP